MDDSRVSPKPQRMQYSTDFGQGGKRNKILYGNGGVHQGGYETENVVSPDYRNNVFQFGSTNDSGFDMQTNADMHNDLIMTGGPSKPKRKKYTYMTLKSNKDNKSKSVSSNLGRMDHTCFI